MMIVATGAFAVEGVTFYASFDRSVLPEVARGGRVPVKVVGFSKTGTAKAVPAAEASETGKFGRGLVLDGSSYVEYPAGKSVGEQAFTVALWFKPLQWGAKTYDNLLGFSENDLNALEFERSHPDGRLRLVVGGPQSKNGGGTKDLWSKTSLKDGEWFHLAATVDPVQQKVTLYVNGVPEAVREGPAPFPANPPSLLVGAGWGRMQRAVKGVVDDLVLLDHAATEEELKAIMAGMQQDGGVFSTANAALSVGVEAATGTLNVNSVRTVVPELLLGPAAPEVRVGGKVYRWSGFTKDKAQATLGTALGSSRQTVFTAPANESGLSLRYHVQLQEQRPLALLWAEVTNTTAEPVKIDELAVLRTVAAGGVSLGTPSVPGRIFLDNGFLCGSGSHPLQQKSHTHTAQGALVVTQPDQGFAATTAFVSFRTATTATNITTGESGAPESFSAVCSYPNGFLLQPGATLCSEVFALGLYGEPHEALERWADTVMAVNELDPPRFCPSGWNSWYCYRLTITEDLILQHARFIKKHWDGLGLENIQIDHGWQDRDIVGNWVANPRFPHGMKWLSEQLEAMGFSLGLWTAVTNASEFAPIYAEHPEAMIQGTDGKPLITDEHWFWEPHGKVSTIDPTSPLGGEFYRKVGEDLKAYGCKYNKNDFQSNLMTGSGTLHDKDLTRGVPVYRLGMDLFAQGRGRDMAYHACNGQLNLIAGQADVAWTHGDLGNPGGRWEWLRGFVRDFSCRYHVSGKFYWSDPDYLQVRESTMQEARVRMVICALGGGPAFLSDRLPEVPADRLALIPKCLPSYKRCATPVDLFERDDYPHIWNLPVQTKWGRWNVLGLFNLYEQPGSITVNLGDLGLAEGERYLVWDFFAEKLLGEVSPLTDADLAIKVPMPETDARVLRVVPKQARPFVLATDMHLTQGGVELPEVKWDEKTLTLSGIATRAQGLKGKVFVYVPEGYSAKGMAGQVVAVPIEFTAKKMTWKVTFVKG